MNNYWGSVNDYTPIIGKTIKHLDLDSSGARLRLEMDDKTVFEFQTEGDCCSHSWIQHIDNIGALRGATITNVEDIEMPNLGETISPLEDYPEVLEYYGLRFTTNKGISVMDYRNNHNGYYGGWVNLVKVK